MEGRKGGGGGGENEEKKREGKRTGRKNEEGRKRGIPDRGFLRMNQSIRASLSEPNLTVPLPACSPLLTRVFLLFFHVPRALPSMRHSCSYPGTSAVARPRSGPRATVCQNTQHTPDRVPGSEGYSTYRQGSGEQGWGGVGWGLCQPKGFRRVGGRDNDGNSDDTGHTDRIVGGLY